MLNRCCPGFTVRLTTHSRLVKYAGRVVMLPKHREIEGGYVRRLLTQLEIASDVAADYIPSLKHR